MILRNLQIAGDTGIKHIHIKNARPDDSFGRGKINAIADGIKQPPRHER